MAIKKTSLDSGLPLDAPGNDADLEQAIDDLRGVLKSDAEGTVPGSGFDADFGAVDNASADLPALGGDFGAAQAETDFGADDFGGDTDFGASSAPRAANPRIQEPGSSLTSNFDLIMDIPIDVQIVLGTSRMQVSGLMNLAEGATIALDRKIGEPVEIMVNGRRIARGEITVLENDDTRFGVKLIEVMSTRKA